MTCSSALLRGSLTTNTCVCVCVCVCEGGGGGGDGVIPGVCTVKTHSELSTGGAK